MKVFRVIYEREPDGWWIVHVPDVQGCHTQGRTITQARGRIREALSLFVPAKTAAAAEFKEEFKLPKAAQRDLAELQQVKTQLMDAKARAAKLERKALKSLRDDVHLGQRDVGELLGVSFQRVHQLEAGTD